MARIERIPSNLFPIPKGGFIRNRVYVYIHTTNKYVSPSEKKEKGTRGYTGHDSVCIGVVENPENANNNKFYANKTYLETLREELPEPPKFADSRAIGLNAWISNVSNQWKLTENLALAFGTENAQLILDLASYMLSSESAVMQHYPAWARDHFIFSDDIYNDTYIGRFLKETITIPKINQFREEWAKENIGEGKIYLCYDSTNVNSQAKGVYIVQKEYAKDDPNLEQVNTDYVVRQSDGLPITYLHSPGSVTDVAQAQEMINLIAKLKKESGKEVQLCLICDRGYISEKNLQQMDANGIGYILMLRTNFSKYNKLADDVIDTIKSYKNEIQTENEDEQYGVTTDCTLYENGPNRKAQIIWSAERYRSGRRAVSQAISTERKKLECYIEEFKGKRLTAEDLKWIPSYFRLKLESGEPIKEEKRKPGRGNATRTIEIPTFIITGYEDDENAINRELQKAGLMIIITSDEMSVQDTLVAYSKRDCVEKTFQALKSHLGMDKIGVTTEEAMHGKGLIWFVASILHAILFNGTTKLRVTDRKNYTVPKMIDELEAIKVDKNLSSGKWKRRYKLTRHQQNILNCFAINEKDIDERIEEISS